MADVLHNTLTAADLHEPKGIAAATQGQVYVADGSGSGIWTSFSFTTPPGMIAPFMTPVAPFGWLELNGAVLNTTTYPALTSALTLVHEGTRVSGQAVITALSSTSNLRVGYYAFGVGIASGTKILSIDSSSQITLSANASSTGTADITFSPWLLGLGTITLPDLTDRGYFLRSRSLNKDVGLFENDDVKPHNHTASGSTSIANAGSHQHSISIYDPGHSHGFFASIGTAGIAVSAGGVNIGLPATSSSTNLNYTGISASALTSGDHSHSATTSVSVNNSSGNETRPYSMSVMYCVKT